MQIVIFIFVFSSVLAALGLAALCAWSDLRGLKIPNIYVLVLAGLFVAGFALDRGIGSGGFFSEGFLSYAGAAFIVFCMTVLMFAVRAIGAGDSKMASACALWAGMGGLAPFLFYMMLAGFFLGVFALAVQKKKPFRAPRPGGWIARLQAEENAVPYGVAIFCGLAGVFAAKMFFLPGAMDVYLL